MARTDLIRALERRLQLVRWHADHPEIGEGAIVRPLVIIGQARTGTTIFHELMALDSANRVPLTWEVDQPFPPPETATYDTDPRIEAYQKELDRFVRMTPDFKKIHRMGALIPQECILITTSEFASMNFVAPYRVPDYARWLMHEADLVPAYRYLRRMLQLLQWHHSAERWVLKSPAHILSLPALLEVFPDACLIHTHRDPLKVLSSVTSLLVVLRSLWSGDVDSHEIGRECSEWHRIGYERAVDLRSSGAIAPEQVIDVAFRDFVADPVAQVRRVYEHFGLTLEDRVAADMRAYVAANPSDRDGKHEHRFEHTGLDLEEERARMRRYQEYFRVASEFRGREVEPDASA